MLMKIGAKRCLRGGTCTNKAARYTRSTSDPGDKGENNFLDIIPSGT